MNIYSRLLLYNPKYFYKKSCMLVFPSPHSQFFLIVLVIFHYLYIVFYFQSFGSRSTSWWKGSVGVCCFWQLGFWGCFWGLGALSLRVRQRALGTSAFTITCTPRTQRTPGKTRGCASTKRTGRATFWTWRRKLGWRPKTAPGQSGFISCASSCQRGRYCTTISRSYG